MASKKSRKVRSALSGQQVGFSSAHKYPSADEIEAFVLEFASKKNHKPATINALRSRLRLYCEFIKEHHRHL